MILTGQGALATNPPIIPVITSAPATTTSASSSATATQTSSSSKSSNIGPIVGGAVGGAAVLLGALVGLLFLCRSRARHGHEQPSKAEPFAIETSQKYDGVPDSKNAQYLASQRTGPGSESNASNNGGAYHSPNPIYGNAFGPTDQHLAYHNQMMMGGAAGAYARSEPASDTQERDMMPPMAGPSTSPNMQQTFQSGGSDPRYSTYSDPRTLSGTNDYAQDRGPRNTMDVRDIAKEVADLLLPQLRTNAASPPPTGGQTMNAPVNNASNPNVGLRNPHAQYASSVFSTPETDRMKSPAPPEYS